MNRIDELVIQMNQALKDGDRNRFEYLDAEHRRLCNQRNYKAVWDKTHTDFSLFAYLEGEPRNKLEGRRCDVKFEIKKRKRFIAEQKTRLWAFEATLAGAEKELKALNYYINLEAQRGKDTDQGEEPLRSPTLREQLYDMSPLRRSSQEVPKDSGPKPTGKRRKARNPGRSSR